MPIVQKTLLTVSHLAKVRQRMIEAAKRGFHLVGIEVLRHHPDTPKAVTSTDIFNAIAARRHEFANKSAAEGTVRFLEFCLENRHQSQAQLLQDIFVLFELAGKRGGYFVEFGATDGVQINNTVLLEREYGWTGVLAEPARFWHERLRSNRKCFISTDCVWRESGATLTFNETPDKELSTINNLSDVDRLGWERVDGECYPVHTVSLLDLLQQAKAPRVIDYMSVDTEGSEFEILEAFDFNAYNIRVLTVEHNYNVNRARLYALLTNRGFVRKFEMFSQWDDWYVRH